MATRMQQRRGTASQWTAANPILKAGELGFETDTNKFKIGDDSAHWADLDYFVGEASFSSSLDDDYVSVDLLGVADGVATLNSSGKLVSTQLPSVDEFAQDAVNSALTMGFGLDKAYDDVANTITLTVDTAEMQARVSGISDTEIGYLNNVSSSIQDQLDDKAPLVSPTFTTPTLGAASATSINSTTIPSSKTLVVTTDKLNVLASTSSSELAGVVSDKTGTGSLVFATLPTFGVTGVKFDGSTSGTTIVLSGATAGSSVLTLPVATDTLVGKATTDTLTGKSIDFATNTFTATADQLRAAVTSDTGTGALVFAIGPTFTGTVNAADLILSGDLTVDGTTTTINSVTLTVDDKNLELGSVASPTNSTADGGGITLKGATDKTFNWVSATTAWTSSEHLDLASGKVLKIAGTEVLSSSEYTGNAATVTSGVYTSSTLAALASTTSDQLRGVISNPTGTGGGLVFATAPTISAATLTGVITASGNLISNINPTAKTAAYTVTTSDYNTLVQMNGAYAFTVNTSLSAAPVGTNITFLALTTGVLVTATGVTIHATPGLKLRAAYSLATLVCIDSNVWVLTGDLLE